MAIFIVTILKSPKHLAKTLSGMGKGGHRVAMRTSQTTSLPLSKNAVRITDKSNARHGRQQRAKTVHACFKMCTLFEY